MGADHIQALVSAVHWVSAPIVPGPSFPGQEGSLGHSVTHVNGQNSAEEGGKTLGLC